MARFEKENPGGLFIPAGLLTGMGIGFMTHNFAAGMFIGLGIGFGLFAVTAFLYNPPTKKKKTN